MIIVKTTFGYVNQVFDTDLKKYINQEFRQADGEIEYTNGAGTAIISNKKMLNPDGSEPYLPFNMVQPRDMVKTKESKWIEPND